MQVIMVISGGQTGIDRMGLEVAKELGIATSGTAPLGYLTEDGPDLSLRDEFGLVESYSAKYSPRTAANALEADGTVVFGNVISPGTASTIALLIKYEKPYICNPTLKELVYFLNSKVIKVLNVAGNRGSKISAGKLQEYRNILKEALSN